jgi:hypothetical protein
MDCEDCTLVNICRHFNSSQRQEKKLSVNQVREAMVILLHHNCLLAEINPLQEDEMEVSASERINEAGLIYSIDEEMVLNRLYIPLALQMVNRSFGKLSSAIVGEVIVGSRVKFDDILRELQPKQNSSDVQWSDMQIETAFRSLVARRILIQLPELDVTRRAKAKESRAVAMFASLGAQRKGVTNDQSATAAASTAKVTKTSTKRKRGPAKIEEDHVAQDELPLEITMMLENDRKAAAAASASSSFETTAKSPTIAIATTIVPDNRSGKLHSRKSVSSSSIEPVNTSQLVLPPEPVFKSLHSHSSQLWTLNWDQIVREERHDLCTRIVTARMEKASGDIIRAMLEASMATESSQRQASSSSMTIQEIYDKIKPSKSSGISQQKTPFDLPIIKKFLDILRQDALGIVDRESSAEHSEADMRYSVNMEALIAYAKRSAILDIASTRYDTQSGRIIALLQHRKFLEQQELADLVILPARDVRERLYRLYKDKWVEFYEMSKRNDFNPSSTFYFWYVDHRRLDDAILNNMYKTMLNLRMR